MTRLSSGLHRKSLQEDRPFRKAGAEVVQTAEEPGQTQFAQKVPRSQVEADSTQTSARPYPAEIVSLHSPSYTITVKQLLFLTRAHCTVACNHAGGCLHTCTQAKVGRHAHARPPCTREAAHGRRLCQQGWSFPPAGMNRSTGQTSSATTG